MIVASRFYQAVKNRYFFIILNILWLGISLIVILSVIHIQNDLINGLYL